MKIQFVLYSFIYVNDFLLNTDPRNLKRYEQHYPIYNMYGVFELPDGAVLRHHNEEYLNKYMKDFKLLVCEKVKYTTMNGNQSNGIVDMERLIK
ncbi:hypothetical protein [Bacillus gaemokensis]|uniref:hypothetical protein n=1 Tax=Bacillus gaemokensis TaxID=574375 RepID=UPI0006920C74|nr:hypothetical protein [Bacillus gaemokensis]KYG36796.1 hypothetical protein AZF08_24445 [Bacillus gaemokensis]